MLSASPAPSPDMPAVPPMQRITRWLAPTRPVTRNQFGSLSIPAASPMAASCRSIFRSPMIRPNSTAKDRTSGRSTARPSSRRIRNRRVEAYIAQLNQAHVFASAIVTKIEPGRDFYPAEDYHQDFLVRNPNYPYVVVNDLPKIQNLKRLFPDLYRATPVLVAAAAPRN